MKKTELGVSVLLFLSAAAPAQAGYIQTLGVDEDCTAIGGACTAVKGDLGAFYENPARVADIRRPRVGVNLRFLDTTDLDLIDSSGNNDIDRTNTKGNIALAPTVAGYIPVNDRVTVGFGIGAPFAITADWENENGIHRYNMSDQALFVLDVAPTIGVRMSDRLSLGITASVTAFKHLRTETLIPDSFGAALPPALGGAGTVIPTGPSNPTIGAITLDTNGDFDILIPPDNVQVDFDEVAFILGAKYDVTDALSLGISGRTRTKSTYDGNVSLDIPALGVNQTETFELRLDGPAHIQGGLKYSVNEKLDLMLDVQRTFWSDATGFGSPAVARFGNPLLGFINDLQIDYQADDASTYRFGGRYKATEKVTLGAGYVRDESIFDDSRVDILTYDSDRNIFSAGINYDMRNNEGSGWILSSALQITAYEERTISTGESVNLGGVSLPNLVDADTLGFSPNRSPFTFGGSIRALSVKIQKVF